MSHCLDYIHLAETLERFFPLRLHTSGLQWVPLRHINMWKKPRIEPLVLLSMAHWLYHQSHSIQQLGKSPV